MLVQKQQTVVQRTEILALLLKALTKLWIVKVFNKQDYAKCKFKVNEFPSFIILFKHVNVSTRRHQTDAPHKSLDLRED